MNEQTINLHDYMTPEDAAAFVHALRSHADPQGVVLLDIGGGTVLTLHMLLPPLPPVVTMD